MGSGGSQQPLVRTIDQARGNCTRSFDFHKHVILRLRGYRKEADHAYSSMLDVKRKKKTGVFDSPSL